MPAGGAVLSHTVRQMLELNPTFVCVALDVQNAHNAIARAAVVRELEAVPGLRHLAQHAAICLAAHHSVESGGEEITKTGQGVTQGDAEAPGLYCVGWHRHVLTLNAVLQLAGGLSIFGNDDGYAIGPAAVVFPAVETFRGAIREHCGLNLRLSKSLVYTQSGEMPTGAPAGMERAGTRAEEGGPWMAGFRCYGVYIGSDAYVRHMLRKEAERICGEIDQVMHLLRQDSQAAWILLSSAMAHQLDYSLTLQYPSDMLECATTVDRRLWAALEQVASQPRIPRGEEGLGVECVVDLPGIGSLQGRSYQHFLIAQPIKLGGLGLRSLEETRFPAFLGGLEQALPRMVVGELCPIPLAPGLRTVIGCMAGQQRWAGMLEAGSRTAVEFRAAWDCLNGEARNVWNYLGVEASGTLADPLEGVGGNSLDGSTRTKIVQQREGLRHQMLEKALKTHPDRDARPVTVYQNVSDDKCAGSWLLAIPSRDNCLSTKVFREAMSSHLCMGSPALRDGNWIGRPVGTQGEVIDRFGDAVLCCHEIPGDSWRHRHDTVKMAVYLEAGLAKVPVDCEVYGLFGDLLPAALLEEGGELQWGRARQGKVPDFKFTLSSPEGPKQCLAELKIISAGKTWFPRGVAGKGTSRRADRLTAEYESKLRDFDVRFHGARPRRAGEPEPVPGPLLARFRGLGGLEEGELVAGPWGDISPHFHQLILSFAESRVAALSRSQGWEAGPGQLGKVVGETRRALSVTIVRANALCLLERLSQLGPGAGAAAKRRQVAVRMEERRRQDRQAFDLAWQARGTSRVGRAFVQ